MHTPAPRHRRIDRRALLLWWAERLERGAESRVLPVRVACEAELAFERWSGEAWRRVAPAVRALATAVAAWLGQAAVPVVRTAAVAAASWLRHAAAPAAARATVHGARLVRDGLRYAEGAYDRFVDDVAGLDRRLSVHLPVALSRHSQRRLAEGLLGGTLLLAVVGVAAASSLHPSSRGLVVDRLAGGAPVRDEALAPRAEQPETTPAAAPAPAAAPGTGAAAPGQGAAPAPPPPAIPAQRGPIPVGKGMWIYMPERCEGGNVDAIVARATAVGLTHLYVRTGTLREGFMAAPFLDQLLPKAHAAGLRVYAWDFPYLNDVEGDLKRAFAAIQHRTPDGHRVDGYAADIELRSMGVNISPATATAFGTTLRRMVGPNYPLIATVPRPSPALVRYPYAEVVSAFDAIAPMVYWLGRDSAADVAGAIAALKVFGKPIIPVGQAYDGAAEGGPPGVPPRDQILAFMKAAEDHGAVSVSWWSWQHADQQAWDAIREAPQFTLPAAPTALTAGQVRAYQVLLATLGFAAPVTGAWDEATAGALRAYQAAARLPATGVLDEATRKVLLSPFAPPVQTQP